MKLEDRNVIGYGERTPDPKWPRDAVIALSFVVNYEEGGENTILNGDAGSEVFLCETPGGPPKVGVRDISIETQFEYGSRCGVWRIMRLFAEHSFPFTCYAVGKAVEMNPNVIKAMEKAGHEIASHNYRWIQFQGLDEETERQYIRSTIKAIQEASNSGKAPVGWYTGRCSEKSRRLVWEEYKKLGLPLLYDCDAYNDDLPYWVDMDGEGHLIIPYTLDQNDMKFSVPPGFGGPEEFYDYLKNSFDTLYSEGLEGAPKMMSIGLHCRLIGKPGRAPILKRFLDYVASHDRVWVATREQIANHWRATHPFQNK